MLKALLLASVASFTSVPSFAAFYAAVGKVEITPDINARRVYLAGYGNGRRATGVHDPLYARGVVLSDGEHTVALVAVDVIGLFREDVQAIRKRLPLDPKRQAVLIAAIHTHSGPDTLGLWGPYQGISGVDDRYRDLLHERVAGLIEKLTGSLQEAELFSNVRPIEMKGRCRDARDPVVMNPDLAVLRLRSVRDKKTIGTVVDWSCHPEVVGRDNHLLSSDFPGQLCADVENESGAPCVYFSGTIGGMQTPDNDALQAGGKDEFQGAKVLGDLLAKEVEKSAKTAERSTPSTLLVKSTTTRLTIENSIYLSFLPSLAFGHVLYGPDGATLGTLGTYWTAMKHVLFRLKPEQLPRIDTELMRLSFGPIEILALPGELLPELYEGGYDGRYSFGYPVVSPGNPGPPDLKQAPKGPYLKDFMTGKQRFVIGLADDEIGYIVPAYDFKTSPKLLMHPYPAGDHYEESNSVGKETAAKIQAAAKEVLSDE